MLARSLGFTLLSVGIVAMANTPTPSPNPLLKEWKTPFGAPPFREIKTEHFLPAFQQAMAAHRKEVAAITKNPAAPTFKNTLEALADAGLLLTKVNNVFNNLTGADTSDALQAVQKEVAPILSKHLDDINLDERLFGRVKAVHDRKDTLKLSPEQARLLTETYKGFVRGGALLKPEQKTRLRAINGELSTLGVQFSENLLKETNAYRLVIERKADLAGLPEGVIAAAADAAKAAGQDGKWVFTLHSPSIWPFLQYAENRELRKQILTAYLTRCDHGNAQDNKKILSRTVALRTEKAHIMGFPAWADFVLDANMAKNPAGVDGLLDKIWVPALAMAKKEAADLQAMIDAEKGGFKLEPWDWRFYAEKVKKAKYDLDEEALRPYFQLEKVRDGAFHLAGKLWGLSFHLRKDVPVYHPEVKAYEVKDKDGSHIGLLLVDDHPRPSKAGGAWMSNYRDQWIRKGKRVAPIIVNVGNYARPAAGKPALLSLDEVETIFHEFGHGLHGLLSQCRYLPVSGTSVTRDFVELPSQIMENWVTEPELLKVYAKHYQTGQAIPEALVQKIHNARFFNQGFATVEFTAAAKLDMAWHTQKDVKEVDATAFETQAAKAMGLPAEIPFRYRSPYFSHIVGGYDAGYYSYLWAAVLDADAFEAFKEAKNIFDPKTAKAFRTNVLEKGNSEDPAELYRKFRGRDPKPEPLLKRRGLL